MVTSTGNVHALDCNTFASRSVLEMGTLDGVRHCNVFAICFRVFQVDHDVGISDGS